MSPGFEFILLCLLVFGMTGNTRGQKLSTNEYKELCNSLSNKAVRSRLKLCNDVGSNPSVKRRRRDINSTDTGKASSEDPSAVDRTCKANPKRSECKNIPVDSKNGYNPSGSGLKLKVAFSKEHAGCWKANVSWEHPIEANSTTCVGYRITWFQQSDYISYPNPCAIIMNKNTTSYIIDPSRGWSAETEQGRLDVAVFPLPVLNVDKIVVTLRGFIIPKTTSTESSTSNPKASSTTTITSNSNLQASSIPTVTSASTPQASSIPTVTSTSTPQGNISQSSTSEGEGNNFMLKLVVATIVTTFAIITVVIFLLVHWIRKSPSTNNYPGLGNSGVETEDETNREGCYISYYSENEKLDKSVIKIASWLKERGIKVILDKFEVIRSRKRAWCERHICEAKRVILIASAGYLNMCKLDENHNSKKTLDCSEKQLVRNEICQIRDKIEESPLTKDHFIVILVDTKISELPFWAKKLKTYTYSNGALDEDILKVLKC